MKFSYTDKMKMVRMKEKGMTPSVIATKLGTVPGYVSNIYKTYRDFGKDALKRKKRMLVSNEANKRAFALKAEGQTALEIANSLGVTSATVNNWLAGNTTSLIVIMWWQWIQPWMKITGSWSKT